MHIYSQLKLYKKQAVHTSYEKYKKYKKKYPTQIELSFIRLSQMKKKKQKMIISL